MYWVLAPSRLVQRRVTPLGVQPAGISFPQFKRPMPAMGTEGKTLPAWQAFDGKEKGDFGHERKARVKRGGREGNARQARKLL